jgi:hypothetical protein
MFLVYVYIYKLTHTHVPTYLIVLPQQNTSFDLWKKREQVSQLNELFVQPRQPETSISHIGEIIYFCYVLMILSENRVASMLILLLEIPYYVSYETFNCRGEGFLNYSNWHRSTVQMRMDQQWGRFPNDLRVSKLIGQFFFRELQIMDTIDQEFRIAQMAPQ